MRAAAILVLLGVSTAGCLKVPEELSEEPDAAAVAPATAAELLDRHVEALGGEEALRALQARTLEARMILYPGEGCPTDDDPFCAQTEEETGSYFYQSTADGRLYRRNVIGDALEERGFDGKVGWAYLAPDTLRIDSPDEMKLNREEAVLHWYLDIAERGVETELLAPRKEDSDGNVRTLDGIAWRVSGTDIEKQLWFDRETGLRREETSGDPEAGNTQVVVYEDYREVDGVLVPHLIRVVNHFEGRAQKIDFAVQRVSHDPIDPTKFAIPELPTPNAEPDTLLAKLAGARTAAQGDAKDVSVWMDYARLAFIAAHFDEAKTALAKVLALDGKEPEALLLSARLAVLFGDYGKAEKMLKRAEKAAVRGEVLAREYGWIHLRERDYDAFASDLAQGGNDNLAKRYRAFEGKPLLAEIDGDACKLEIPLATQAPLATLDVQLGGKKVGAIFDTGAADLIITQSLADELGMEITASSQIAEGMPPVGHGQIPTLQVGGLTLKNVPANVFDDAAIADMAGDEEERISAVLGIGMFTDFAVALDVPQSKLELVPSERKCKAERAALVTGPSIPFWMHETHYIYVMGSMNGSEGVYLVNTGMRGADMTANPQAYRHAGVATPPLQAGEAPMAKVETFELGEGLRVGDVASAWGYFQQTQSSDGFRLDGMIGLGVLGHERFVFDFDNHALHFPGSAG